MASDMRQWNFRKADARVDAKCLKQTSLLKFTQQVLVLAVIIFIPFAVTVIVFILLSSTTSATTEWLCSSKHTIEHTIAYMYFVSRRLSVRQRQPSIPIFVYRISGLSCLH